MNAGLAIIAGAAGIITYKMISDKSAVSSQPDRKEPEPFWNDWLKGGNQPQTGNGPPKSEQDQTGHDVANVITGLSKFGTSLLQFFGTSESSGGKDSGGGSSSGGPVESYSNGGQDW